MGGQSSLPSASLASNRARLGIRGGYDTGAPGRIMSGATVAQGDDRGRVGRDVNPQNPQNQVIRQSSNPLATRSVVEQPAPDSGTVVDTTVPQDTGVPAMDRGVINRGNPLPPAFDYTTDPYGYRGAGHGSFAYQPEQEASAQGRGRFYTAPPGGRPGVTGTGVKPTSSLPADQPQTQPDPTVDRRTGLRR